jgi:hypothetical protein
MAEFKAVLVEGSHGMAAAVHLRTEDFGLTSIVGNGPGFIPDQAALGGDVRTLTQPVDGSADYFFRMTQPLDRGSIDPIDASLKACVNCDEGLCIVLRAPCKLPLSATDRPSSDANRRDIKVALS